MMDGLSTNLAMCRLFGCSFDLPNNIQTSFLSPSNGLKINVVLDACHMLKLMRNTFFSYQILSYNGNTIKWEFLQNLVNYQQQIKMKIANKLTINHIEFQNHKMKVKYAEQLFSSARCLISSVDWRDGKNISMNYSTDHRSTLLSLLMMKLVTLPQPTQMHPKFLNLHWQKYRQQ